MTLDYLIIGAGPAGLQLGALMESDGSDYLVLEAADGPGAFFRTFPRHRQLISINKPHTGTTDPELNLRLDWNSLLAEDAPLFTGYTGRYFPDADVMVRYLADFAAKTGVKIRYNARVTRIRKDGDEFLVSTGEEDLRAKKIIMATGVSRMNIPEIPGIEHAERYDTMDTDPDGYTDQRVLILGKGNSAFETADALIETTTLIHVAGPHDVKFAWRTHFVGHLRAVNNNFLDTYQLKSANAILDGRVRGIDRDGDDLVVTFAFARVEEVTKQLRYDRVIACTGFAFDASVFDETCRPELAIDDRFPKQTASWESVNVPGLYFAGTITQQRDFKKSTSGFIHGFRYAVRALHKVLTQRWPATQLETHEVTDAIIARVNRSSALWQQFGFLADVVLPDGRYLEEMPVALFHERHPDGLVVTLEYGPDHDQVDPFDISVSRIAQDTPGQAHDAAYLHPVVRAYRDGQLTGTHHLAENLENRWDRPDVHVGPLAAFLTRHR
ncbi:NAD(P)-binding domain-containing protein [Paractinoplanes toevensis]|uniref:Pyridine nucleotide-disulfide oxidoreductase n=1 Tax=Paractinoplanes toevensis TaxID=571911 RepID=A0A919TGK0_9ACTN|nr:NAD(P)-binding domain-containing protein [Actinoplanes toevensis]GIM94942.1 pyridine nucleotide-disulfide oxidoreductase [Actinoplanes toevensis]